MRLTLQFSILLGCVLSTTTIFSQIDTNSGAKEKSKTKIILLENSKPVNKSKSIELDATQGFKKAYEKEKKKIKKKKKEEEIKNKGIITKELARKLSYQKFIEKHTLQIPMIDMDIGVFKTKSENINLFAFDFGTIDGDKIAIYKNGVLFKDNITLKASGGNEVVSIPLDIGFNKIEILALSEGTLRPNTGALTLFDDYKREVFSDLWNLAKGAKIIGHIIRE